ncbi:MAG: bifunctional adenosylcobinamide kinase/adenosylcobinamide-phosphate guanylyltransferase, partial [Gammaproteobacteria bacterium]|nr:bifunctional adenosylcobinamide kinase/adenosylcobinamide-phosphate guanylyltransferase [Gammaproteobacteria bacterium]
TAQALDSAMHTRIESHRARRPAHWRTLEEPLALANCLQEIARGDRCIIVDCLTLWLTNLLLNDDPQRLTTELESLYSVLPTLRGTLILVSNETGLGITPIGDLTRQFGDAAGLMHQQLATLCDRVILTVAGLPLTLKDNSR